MDSPRPSKIGSLAADPFASLPSQLTSSLIGSARTKAKWDVLPPGAHSITARAHGQPGRVRQARPAARRGQAQLGRAQHYSPRLRPSTTAASAARVSINKQNPNDYDIVYLDECHSLLDTFCNI